MSRQYRGCSVSYPSEGAKKDAVGIMRPPGLSSQVYNTQQLHKRLCQEDQGYADENPPHINDGSYYKARTTREQPSTYDRIYNSFTGGYDQKLHRDDRAFAKSRGLYINQEETEVKVPLLSSSVYGHPTRNPLEFVDRKHVHVQTCKKDFLRLGGTNIGSNPDLH